MKVCSSCGVKVETMDNWVEFHCPSCGKTTIVRCSRCRKLGNTYECESCGVIGP
ncbi:MAG: DUF1610 domain-containing protein [Candidatus Aenigmarchaeota archaeon]|nr:DUF1610 domain-containing protein [Candidatus Aenigmarchaeota archaeon]